MKLRLHQFLSKTGVFSSKAEAKQAIWDGEITVNGSVVKNMTFQFNVKANERLSLAEMRRLLEDMRTIANPWACVHGRPTVLRLTMDHLDRHFGRHG